MATRNSDACNSNVLVEISDPKNPTVDIIAVHGMNAKGNESHAEDTWTDDKTNKNWLREFLPNRLPSARILAFQYNSNVVFGTSSAGVEEQAVNLLGCLKQKREDDPVRPIIFVTHSLGGIIVKEALATAYDDHQRYLLIWPFTYAIFFIAVPHKGSPSALWGQVAAGIVGAVANEPSNSLLESIVPQESEALGLPANREHRRVANRNHRTICKFAGIKNPEWIELSAAIVEAAQSAEKSIDFSPTMHHRKRMFEIRALKDEEAKAVSLPEASNRAQAAIDKLKEFRNSKELSAKQEEAREAQGIMGELATSLTSMIPKLIKFAATVLSSGIGSLVMSFAPALLPSKQHALEEAGKAQESEQKIMEVEKWAIEMLNDIQRETLQALHEVDRAAAAWNTQPQNGGGTLQLKSVSNQRHQLIKMIESICKELRERQKSFNRAKYVSDKIEVIREEAANQNLEEFWRSAAANVQEEQAKKEDDSGCCVIL